MRPWTTRPMSLGIFAGDSFESCARTTRDRDRAADWRRGSDSRSRDRHATRPVRAGDVAILFRTRESHREYERALEERGISAYVYKGLGFFDADEVKDVLAHPLVPCRSGLEPSICRAAALALRPDLGRGLRRLGPNLAEALLDSAEGVHPRTVALDDDDEEALRLARASRPDGVRWPIGCRRLNCSIASSRSRRMRGSSRVSAWRRREKT